jgi:uroporphyrinogen-III decarboxylase
VLTYDLIDNEQILTRYGGYDRTKEYDLEGLLEVNARAYANIGLDVTRSVYDPVNHWMGIKIVNWVQFLGADPEEWEVSQKGGTAWISKRPFSNLRELEKKMPNPPRFEEVREWYAPLIRKIQEVFDAHDVAFVGAVEGPLTDAYTYMDMELFATATYDAPELVSHILDCTGKFSAYIARVFAENASTPMLFMGEDIAGSTGPIFSPRFVREQGLPRWKWIVEPIHEKGYKFLFHTDGRYGEFLPLIFDELGADGLNPIERMGCNDIFEIRERYPDKLLFGNVCCASTLPHGSPEDVEDETLELLERIAPQGGILIGSSSEVHDLVPVENAARMYQTVREYGSYPIDVERIRRQRGELRGRVCGRG